MDGLQGYKAFLRAVEIGSFSNVGKELGISQSAVSRRIATLEAELGVQLFVRTTRKLRPTDDALLLYPHVRQLVDALGGIKSSAKDGNDLSLSGTLRLSLPNSFGRKCIIPLLPSFLLQHPQVAFDIRLTNQMIDLVEEGIELGIHIGNLPPSTLIARSIGVVKQKLVATPTYLKKFGRPESPVELSNHRCITLAGPTQQNRWEFESELGRQVIDITGIVRTNNFDAVYDAVLAHIGIALIPDWVIGSDILEGRVELLLNEYSSAIEPIRFIYPQTRFLSSRARYFIDYCINQLTK